MADQVEDTDRLAKLELPDMRWRSMFRHYGPGLILMIRCRSEPPIVKRKYACSMRRRVTCIIRIPTATAKQVERPKFIRTLRWSFSIGTLAEGGHTRPLF